MTWEEIVKVKFQGPPQDPEQVDQGYPYRVGYFVGTMKLALENLKKLIEEHPDMKNNRNIKNTIRDLEDGLKVQDNIDRYKTYKRKDYPEEHFKR
tara:strand:+ start:315 stop:599 length:285 start_codon:yes stop_codon:yes gene_type:complete